MFEMNRSATAHIDLGSAESQSLLRLDPARASSLSNRSPCHDTIHSPPLPLMIMEWHVPLADSAEWEMDTCLIISAFEILSSLAESVRATKSTAKNAIEGIPFSFLDSIKVTLFSLLKAFEAPSDHIKLWCMSTTGFPRVSDTSPLSEISSHLD
jgi:hypothetical protein